MLIVQVCDFGNDGDAEYRMHSPSRQMGKQPGITAVDCHFSHRCLPALGQSADVMVFQFINDWELLSLCQRRSAAGLLTIFEANDDFFDLQPWSPIAVAWQDRTVQELFLQLLATADGVQTSSAELARRWSSCGAKQVAIFRNQLAEIDALPKSIERPLTVGWGGSPGHFADWYELAPLLTQWLIDHPEVHLAVMTHELAHSFIQIPPERYHFTKFGSLRDYVSFLRSLDIGLAPLVATGYNRGRSDVKYLEYASQGVAGIYADLEPYRSSVVHGATGLVSRSPTEMIEHLELLRTNPDLRLRLRQQAYDQVKVNRQLPDRIGDRIAWYRSLLKQPIAPTSQLPLVVDQAAVGREDCYWQLHPQQPEQALLDSMRQPDKHLAVNSLKEQIDREPNYLAALVRQGQLMNDIRDHHQALVYLERARNLMPQNARTLCEIGRAWFCLNDLVQSRKVLEDAIQTDPKYLPAWQYFLRMLSMTHASDGPVWARRVEELFPDCYPLQFLGAQVYPTVESLIVLTRMIDRMASTIVKRERMNALSAVRKALRHAIPLASEMPGLVFPLRRAHEVFPESAWLASELGAALYRSGHHREAYAYQAKAYQIRQQAEIYRDEFTSQEVAPWSWQFADHLFDHGSSSIPDGIVQRAQSTRQ